jgi:bacteriocin biosynthesis cyclodehydratase domain-containing protein
MNLRKPRLPSHYFIWSEPPDETGDEVLHFVSERRRLKLKGHSFRELESRVLPLLDGRRTVGEIQAAVADVFAPQDVEDGIALLAAQGLLGEGAGEGEASEEKTGSPPQPPRWEPQRNFLHEVLGEAEEVSRRLAASVVSVMGLGGAGADAALALAKMGIGEVRLVDSLPVGAADPYFSEAFHAAEPGLPRTTAAARRFAASAPWAKAVEVGTPLADDAAVVAAVAGSHFAICCLDAGQSWTTYKLNRACLELGLPWTSVALAGTEVVLGPTVVPHQTACYLCYRMRAVACAGNPEDAFAYERYLDRRRQDDSGRRENLAPAAGIAAQMAALEAVKALSGLRPSALGGLVILDLLGLGTSRHTVLRKPGCPACFPERHDP